MGASREGGSPVRPGRLGDAVRTDALAEPGASAAPASNTSLLRRRLTDKLTTELGYAANPPSAQQANDSPTSCSVYAAGQFDHAAIAGRARLELAVSP